MSWSLVMADPGITLDDTYSIFEWDKWEFVLDEYGRTDLRLKQELTQEEKFNKSYMEL